jgi:RecA/RadA recombinase
LATLPKPGSRVVTDRLGAGMIIKLTEAGALVALDDFPGTPIELTLAQLSSADGASFGLSGTGASPRHAQAEALEAGQYAARRSIEALRFGIVPLASIEEITVGFEDVEEWVESCLPHNLDGRSSVSEVSGSFGSGKSHAMAAIRGVAQKAGYVTASVEVNGDGISLSDPEGLLRQLWPTAAAAGLESATPILDLHLRAIDKGRGQVFNALWEFDRVQANLTTVETLRDTGCLDPHAEDVDNFLSSGNDFTAYQLRDQLAAELRRQGVGRWDSPIVIKRLIGNRLDERAHDFVNCLLGYAVVAQRAGYKGLVITIDEFEVEHNLSLSHFERVRSLVRTMVDELSQDAPLSVFIATVGQEGHEGDAVVEALVEATSGGLWPLDEWTGDSLRELAKRIHALYCKAYMVDDAFDERLLRSVDELLADDELDDSPVRAFIKQYVAVLDVTYGPLQAI